MAIICAIVQPNIYLVYACLSLAPVPREYFTGSAPMTRRVYNIYRRDRHLHTLSLVRPKLSISSKALIPEIGSGPFYENPSVPSPEIFHSLSSGFRANCNNNKYRVTSVTYKRATNDFRKTRVRRNTEHRTRDGITRDAESIKTITARAL